MIFPYKIMLLWIMMGIFFILIDHATVNIIFGCEFICRSLSVPGFPMFKATFSSVSVWWKSFSHYLTISSLSSLSTVVCSHLRIHVDSYYLLVILLGFYSLDSWPNTWTTADHHITIIYDNPFNLFLEFLFQPTVNPF